MGSAPRERQGTGAIRGFLLVNRRGLWDESVLQLRLDVLNGWFQMVSGYDSRPTPGAATVVSLKGLKELRMGIEKREELRRLLAVPHAGFQRSFAGYDLSGLHLVGADLSGADLRGANLSGANLEGANFSGAKLDDRSLGEASTG